MALRFRINAVFSDAEKWTRETAKAINSALSELYETEDGVSATSPNTQAGAKQLKIGFSRVTTGSTNNGLLLPFSEGGETVVIRNDCGNNIKVWPPKGCQIDDRAVNTVDPNAIATDTSRTYRAISSTDWYTVGNS